MTIRSTLTMLAVITLADGVHADDWPQWMGPTRDGVWAETGIVEKLPSTLKRKWSVPVKYGYAGPAVESGRVFVADFDGEGDFTPDPGKSNKIAGVERLICLDAATGQEKWKYEDKVEYNLSYPAGPRATPTVVRDKVYFLGAMGHLRCLSAKRGEVEWEIDLREQFGAKLPIWGFCAHPLVFEDRVYVMAGGPGSVVVCLDGNGKVLWKKLSAPHAGYCPPSVIEAGGRKQLLVVHPKSINSLDPANGEVFWSVPFEPAYEMSICRPMLDGDILFTAGEGDKAVALKLAADKPAATELWRGKANNAVYPICGTPIPYKGHLYGVDTNGELRCVDLKDGRRVWSENSVITGQRRAPSGSAFIVRNGERFFIASETGELIVANLTPKKYEEVNRAKLIEPTGETWSRKVVWSHPAFADKCVFARNDKEIVCVSLAAE
jgi:outer membrane protein assembly factor BamB